MRAESTLHLAFDESRGGRNRPDSQAATPHYAGAAKERIGTALTGDAFGSCVASVALPALVDHRESALWSDVVGNAVVTTEDIPPASHTCFRDLLRANMNSTYTGLPAHRAKALAVASAVAFVGPVIRWLELPAGEPMMAGMIAVCSPCTGLTPAMAAYGMDRGTATMATVEPAIRSGITIRLDTTGVRRNRELHGPLTLLGLLEPLSRMPVRARTACPAPARRRLQIPEQAGFPFKRAVQPVLCLQAVRSPPSTAAP